jgi:retron-type reverse transcriptase
VVETGTGTQWWIADDIKGWFDNIEHAVLLALRGETIHDHRCLRLIRPMLQAGYLERWVFGHPLSGTPQGGVVSPIRATIYLDRWDQCVEHALLPVSRPLRAGNDAARIWPSSV